MAAADTPNDAKRELAFADALHPIPHFDAASGGAVGSRIVAGLSTRENVDQVLGGANAPKFELVSAAGDGTFQPVQAQPDVQQDIKNLLHAAIKGDSWGPAADAWRKAFQSELAVNNTTPEHVLAGLNSIGAAINSTVKGPLSQIPGRIPEPVGMAMVEEGGKYYYYMMLNKDPAALAANHLAIATGKETDTVIKLGPFTPEKPGRKT